MKSIRSGCQRGFSLLEMAVALAMLGLAAATVLPLYKSAAEQELQLANQEMAAQTRRALIGYAARYGRLPCPAAKAGNGKEVCDGRASGPLPFVTLGLLDQEFQFVEYKLLKPEAMMSPLLPRFEVLRPSGPAEARVPLDVKAVKLADEIVGRSGRSVLDFCALAQTTPQTNEAFVEFWYRTDAHSEATSGGAPEALSSADLWSGVSCASFVSVDGRSRFNLALGASTALRALIDLQNETKSEVNLLELDVVMGGLDVALAQVSAINSAARLSNSVTFAMIAKDITVSQVVPAGLNTTAAQLAVLPSIANLVRYQTNLTFVKDWETELSRERQNVEQLEKELVERARQSNQDTLLLAAQDS